MKKQIMLIASLSAFAAGAAFAGEYKSQFQKLDDNQDGYISAAEARDYEALNKQWGMVDNNNDNQIDQAEFSAFEMGAGSGETGQPETGE